MDGTSTKWTLESLMEAWPWGKKHMKCIWLYKLYNIHTKSRNKSVVL